MMGERQVAQEALFHAFSRAIRQAEVGSARTMLDRTQEGFRLWRAKLAADSAYSSDENLAWLARERGIEPHTRSSTNPSAATAHSAAPTSPTTMPAISTPARPGRSSTTIGDASVSGARASPPKASCATAPASSAVTPAS